MVRIHSANSDKHLVMKTLLFCVETKIHRDIEAMPKIQSDWCTFLSNTGNVTHTRPPPAGTSGPYFDRAVCMGASLRISLNKSTPYLRDIPVSPFNMMLKIDWNIGCRLDGLKTCTKQRRIVLYIHVEVHWHSQSMCISGRIFSYKSEKIAFLSQKVSCTLNCEKYQISIWNENLFPNITWRIYCEPYILILALLI